MKVIGLTGGIGSGKSTVSNYLKKKGFPIIDADVIARDVVPLILDKLIETFGKGILNEDESLNRKKLSGMVFSNKSKLEQLNSITHPIIRKEIEKTIKHHRNKNVKYIILDIALLFEANMLDLVDVSWLVFVDKKTQLTRTMNRDNSTEQETLNKIELQFPINKKMIIANKIINNSYDFSYTKIQIDSILKDYAK